MLLNLFRSGFDFGNLIIYLFSMAFVVFCTLPIHEFAHAWVATKLGDQTPRLQGRLTVNPMAHISPIGALMILLVGFGYAKPVGVNPRNFKDPKKGMALVAIAGPVSNLIMGFIAEFFAVLCVRLSNGSSNSTLLSAIYLFFWFAASVNVQLAVFNLLPIPPLDGSRILQLLIPSKYYFKVMQYERYIVLVVFALLFTGILTVPLSFLSGLIMGLYQKLFNLILL
ncbi:MAG: site-2 protease family protein [Oscillospiraceae bacterium]|nr:site-2 protease family protein [Oscillospiraceae bacterium]